MRPRVRERIRAHPNWSTLLIVALLVPPSLSQAADPVGRLFYTPQQRQDLDRRRQANILEAVVSGESAVTVNGQVVRSSGKSTTWINGVPQDDTATASRPSIVTIGGQDGEPRVNLKVGQTLDKARNEVQDGLGGGEVRVPPGKPR